MKRVPLQVARFSFLKFAPRINDYGNTLSYDVS